MDARKTTEYKKLMVDVVAMGGDSTVDGRVILQILEHVEMLEEGCQEMSQRIVGAETEIKRVHEFLRNFAEASKIMREAEEGLRTIDTEKIAHLEARVNELEEKIVNADPKP